MTARLSAWYRSRSPRERVLLAAALALALLILGWAIVAVPFRDSLAAARARHEASVGVLARARAEAEARRAAPQPGAPLGAPVATIVSGAAAEAGFAGAQVSPAGESGASFAIEAARAQALFAWIRALEQRGIAVSSLRVEPNADRTVRAAITFQGRRP